MRKEEKIACAKFCESRKEEKDREREKRKKKREKKTATVDNVVHRLSV